MPRANYALLPVSLAMLNDLLQLPEGYELATAQYDMNYQVIRFLVVSDALPEVPEGGQLPCIRLHVQVDFHPDTPEYRKITIAPQIGA